ncbi:hypothetical protein QYF36_019117 [Acer negundo]|nr:hypothetical protein QYF36_019117 [Acer negundo]
MKKVRKRIDVAVTSVERRFLVMVDSFGGGRGGWGWFSWGNWGVKISDVRFNDIYGTTLTQIAVTLNCIESNPCRKFQMKDINIACHRVGGPAKSYCSYAHGASYGQEYPPSCLI